MGLDGLRVFEGDLAGEDSVVLFVRERPPGEELAAAVGTDDASDSIGEGEGVVAGDDLREMPAHLYGLGAFDFDLAGACSGGAGAAI